MKAWDRVKDVLGIRSAPPSVRKTIVDRAHAEGESSIGAIDGITVATGGEVWPRSEILSMTAARVYMVVPSVFTVINKKAQMLSSAPLRLYRTDTRTGQKVEHTAGIMAKLIRDPHPFSTGIRLVQEIVLWKELCGRAYLLLDQYDGKHYFTMLEPYFVHAVVDPDTKLKAYVYQVNGGRPIYIPADNVAEFDNFNPRDYYFGMTAIEPLSRDIEAERYTKQWYVAQMKRGNMQGGAIGSEKAYDDEELLKMKAEWKARKPDSSHVLFLPNKMTFTPFKEQGEDKLMREVLNETFDAVALAYGMHPILFGHSNSPRPEPIMDIETFVWNTVILPEMTYISEVITKKFGPIAGANFSFEFDTNDVAALRRSDMDNIRVAVATTSIGLQTVNEWRISRDLPPYTSKDGSEMEEFGRLAFPVWEQLMAAKQLQLSAALTPTKNADGTSSPGPGLTAADQTSHALPTPGSEGGRRDQSQSGEPQMIDHTGKRSFDDFADAIINKRAPSLLAKINELERFAEEIED